MTAKTTTPFSWLKKVSQSLIKIDSAPLFQQVSSLSLNSLSAILAKRFDIEGLTIQITEQKWREEQDLLTGFGSDLISLCLVLTPLEGPLYFILNSSDLEEMLGWVAKSHDENALFHLPQEYKDAFIRFVTLEILESNKQLFEGLSPQILEGEKKPEGPAFALDLTISHGSKNVFARILVSSDLQRSWKEKCAHQGAFSPYWQEKAETIPITLHLEIGKTRLSAKEWKKVKEGDFILLDTCTISPEAIENSQVLLTVESRPLLIGAIEKSQVRITEKPLLHEVEEDMDREEEEVEDFDEEFEEEDIAPEVETESASTEPAQSEPPVEADPPAATLPPLPKAPNDTATQVAPKTKKPFSVEDLSLPLSIEVGRVHMSVKQLMELQPGNLVNLEVHPEQGVDLVVNGKLIGKGELLRLGETLGVRVIDLFT